MITTENIGKHENVAVATFGTGDIGMHQLFYDDGNVGLALGTHIEPHEVGEVTAEYNGRGIEHLPSVQIVLDFNNPASLNALIHSLVELQKQLLLKHR